jgi:hypothetical protein
MNFSSGLNGHCSDETGSSKKSSDHRVVLQTVNLIFIVTAPHELHWHTLCRTQLWYYYTVNTVWLIEGYCLTDCWRTRGWLPEWTPLTVNSWLCDSYWRSPLNNSKWCNTSGRFYFQIFPGPSTSFYRLRMFWGFFSLAARSNWYSYHAGRHRIVSSSGSLTKHSLLLILRTVITKLSINYL